MKNIFKILILFILISFSGCGKDYFDINTPTGSVNDDLLTMNDLLAPVIFHTVRAQYYAERTFGNYAQNITGQSGTAESVVSNASSWAEIYLYALPNLKLITEKSNALNAKYFEGVAEILTAINLGLATDSWGNIPYLQASQWAENLTPEFDTQESVYQSIFLLLDNAILNLSSNDESGYKPTEKSDLIYRGDLSKWLKAAYTLKARYIMHLIKRNGFSNSAQLALIALENGFTSNEDDFQMTYTEKLINPWYSREVLAKHTGNDHDKIGFPLVSYMNGSTYPFAGGKISIDPRLPEYAQINDTSSFYRGYISGGYGISGDSTLANTDFREDGFYTNQSSPIVLISYSEAMFIKAEAEFLANGGNTKSSGITDKGYQAYISGIQSNMSKLDVSSVDYIADSSIDVGAANLMLHNIMKEKYIANFLNPETYVDLRRYDFSQDVFRNFALPADNAVSEFPGLWLVRADYPESETLRNPDNVNANKKAPTQTLWWQE